MCLLLLPGSDDRYPHQSLQERLKELQHHHQKKRSCLSPVMFVVFECESLPEGPAVLLACWWMSHVEGYLLAQIVVLIRLDLVLPGYSLLPVVPVPLLLLMLVKG